MVGGRRRLIVRSRGASGPPAWDPALKRITNVGTWQIDAKGNTVRVNTRMAQMLGYSPDELTGKPPAQFMDGECGREWESHFRRRSQGLAEQYELRFRRRDGKPLWVSIAAIPSFDRNGRFKGALAEMVDVTPLKERECELDALRRMHLAMLTALEDAFVRKSAAAITGPAMDHITEPASYEEIMAFHLVQAACEITEADGGAYFRNDVQRGRLVLLGSVGFPQLAGSAAHRGMRLRRDNGIPGTVASTLRPRYEPDLLSNPEWISGSHPGMRSAYWVPVMDGGTLFGVYCIISRRVDGFSSEHRVLADILASAMSSAMQRARLFAETQRQMERVRQVQAQLLQAQKMEAIGQIAAGMAHDLNNYLAAIRGLTDLVATAPPAECGSSDDAFRLIREAVDRAASLTHRLLLLSRKQPEKRIPLNLNDAVVSLLNLLRRPLGDRIEVRLELSDDLAMISADPSNIDQMLTNLVINARDAMPGGGSLTVRTENVVIAPADIKVNLVGNAPGPYVCLTVIDTGTGMSPEVVEHVFEPFFTTRKSGEGSGLGLSVTHGIVHAHDGWIDVSSEVGKGASFKVFLPAIREPAARDCAMAAGERV